MKIEKEQATATTKYRGTPLRRAMRLRGCGRDDVGLKFGFQGLSVREILAILVQSTCYGSNIFLSQDTADLR